MSPFLAFSAISSTAYAHEASATLKRDLWVVTKPFSFYIGDKHSGRWVHVPIGFMTDGASVPRMLWSFIPPWGVYGQAVILHDFLCEYLSITVDGLPADITRQYADELFDEAMKVLRVPDQLRETIFNGVSAYRVVSQVNVPSNTPAKREQEALWMKLYGNLE